VQVARGDPLLYRGEVGQREGAPDGHPQLTSVDARDQFRELGRIAAASSSTTRTPRPSSCG